MRMPGLLSASAASSADVSASPACFFATYRSTSHRTHPPAKIGVDADRGRYTPTANASDGMPLISSTIARPTPRSTSSQGSLRLRIPLMMYDMSVAFGASNLTTREPSGRVAWVPLMPGSTRYTALPASFTKYRPAGPPSSSVLFQTQYVPGSVRPCGPDSFSRTVSFETSVWRFAPG